MINKIKQLFCKHKFIPFGEEKYVGYTIGYDLKPTCEFEMLYKCEKCGKENVRKYIYFGNIKDERRI